MAQLFTHQVAPDATVDAHDAPDRDAPRIRTRRSRARPSRRRRIRGRRDPSGGAGTRAAPARRARARRAGVVLGVTVIWFFAAIPIGVAAVVVGIVARRRVASYHDPRAASRATIATALGCVAILLGVTGAIFLPRVMDRADRFLASIQQDVNDDVGLVNDGLSPDVNRLDRTLTRDLDASNGTTTATSRSSRTAPRRRSRSSKTG